MNQRNQQYSGQSSKINPPAMEKHTIIEKRLDKIMPLHNNQQGNLSQSPYKTSKNYHILIHSF